MWRQDDVKCLLPLYCIIILFIFHITHPDAFHTQHINENASKKETSISVKNEVSASVPDSTLKPVVKNILNGIDISHYQGRLLQELKHLSSLDFVICKASQGAYYQDPTFSDNWQSIHDLGLIRGAYHFYVAHDNPSQQANHFYQVVGDISAHDIAPIVDIEHASFSKEKATSGMIDEFKVFLQKTIDNFGYRPIIYTNYSFAQQYLNDPYFAQYPLWIAEYTSRQKPIIPIAWKETGFFIWQKNSSYHVNSVNTDFDVFFGTADELVNKKSNVIHSLY